MPQITIDKPKDTIDLSEIDVDNTAIYVRENGKLVGMVVYSAPGYRLQLGTNLYTRKYDNFASLFERESAAIGHTYTFHTED